MNRRIGDEIKDIVQNAVNSRDFRQLNRDIENTVNSALDEVRRALSYPKDGSNRDNPGGFGKQHGYEQHNSSQTYSTGTHARETKVPQPTQEPLFPYVPIGKVSGILLTVFGSIACGITGIIAFILLLTGVFSGNYLVLLLAALVMLPLLSGSIFMLVKGIQLNQRLKRSKRYFEVMQNRSYYTIKDLSAHTGLNTKFIVKDMRKMIAIGMFPEGHIDEQETCLMLNHESYQLYLELQKKIQMERADSQKDTHAPTQEQATNETMDTELRAAIENGRACIRQIKEANDAIPGEYISAKLFLLEGIIEKIFNYVELHPEQLPQIQKFMDYYLPTTLKLVNTYKDFDNQPVQGENITAAKNEIESTLDTINLAFGKLYDNLFSTVAMDVSTDISVLQTLLAQEGLTQKDFKSHQSTGGSTNESRSTNVNL